MDNKWNQRHLRPPTMSSYTTKLTKFVYASEITETLEAIANYYANQQRFHEAMLINQKLLYLRHTQFRSDIGFQQLQKLSTAYKRIVSMDISALLRKILKSISIEKYNNQIQLPTKETFGYLAIKLMGLFKLIVRVVECSLEAAQYFMKLASLSFFVELTTVYLAALSETYTIGCDLARKTIKYYNKLMNYYAVLKWRKKTFELQNNFKLPTKLQDEFIDASELQLIKYKEKHEVVDNSCLQLEKQNTNIPKVMKVNKLIQQSSIETGCEILRSTIIGLVT